MTGEKTAADELAAAATELLEQSAGSPLHEQVHVLCAALARHSAEAAQTAAKLDAVTAVRDDLDGRGSYSSEHVRDHELWVRRRLTEALEQAVPGHRTVQLSLVSSSSAFSAADVYEFERSLVHGVTGAERAYGLLRTYGHDGTSAWAGVLEGTAPLSAGSVRKLVPGIAAAHGLTVSSVDGS